MGVPKTMQGFLYGSIFDNGKVTGNQVAYIYPGTKLALMGKFKNNQMISAHAVTVEKILCKNNFLTIEFGKASGPKFHHSSSTNVSLGDMPLVEDPYEARTVKIVSSNSLNSGMVHISCFDTGNQIISDKPLFEH